MKGAQVRKTAGGNRMHSRKSPIQTTYRENLWKTGKPPEFDPLGAFLVTRQRKQHEHRDDQRCRSRGVFKPFVHASTHFKSVTRPVTAAMTMTTFA